MLCSSDGNPDWPWNTAGSFGVMYHAGSAPSVPLPQPPRRSGGRKRNRVVKPFLLGKGLADAGNIASGEPRRVDRNSVGQPGTCRWRCAFGSDPGADSRGHFDRLATVATGLTAPNWGTFAPGFPDRLFVTDQNGILWAVDLTTGARTVFLDVSSRRADGRARPSRGGFSPGVSVERPGLHLHVRAGGRDDRLSPLPLGVTRTT